MVDATGDTIDGATIVITNRTGGTPATVYTSETSQATLTSLTTDNGRIPGWLEEGSYQLVITHVDLPGSPWTRAVEIVHGAGVTNLVANVVTANKVVDNAITAAKLADSAITTTKITDDILTSSKLADGAASTRTIAATAVDAAALAADSIDMRVIADDAVGTAEFADNAVGTTEIVDSAVIAGKIADNAITEGKIQDDAVTNDKLVDGTLTTAKLADGGFQNSDFTNSVLSAGVIMAFPSTPPAPWLYCDGAEVSADTYPQLYMAIGYSYGGAGASFNLPDLRGRVPYGYNSASGISFGGDEGWDSYLQYRTPRHGHTSSLSVTGAGTHEHFLNRTVFAGKYGGMSSSSTFYGWYIPWQEFGGINVNASSHSHSVTGASGGISANVDRPAFLTLKYYIKGA